MTCTTIMKTLKKETFLSFEYSFVMQLSHLGVSHNFPQDEDALAEGFVPAGLLGTRPPTVQ